MSQKELINKMKDAKNKQKEQFERLTKSFPTTFGKSKQLFEEEYIEDEYPETKMNLAEFSEYVNKFHDDFKKVNDKKDSYNDLVVDYDLEKNTEEKDAIRDEATNIFDELGVEFDNLVIFKNKLKPDVEDFYKKHIKFLDETLKLKNKKGQMYFSDENLSKGTPEYSLPKDLVKYFKDMYGKSSTVKRTMIKLINELREKIEDKYKIVEEDFRTNGNIEGAKAFFKERTNNLQQYIAEKIPKTQPKKGKIPIEEPKLSELEKESVKKDISKDDINLYMINSFYNDRNNFTIGRNNYCLVKLNLSNKFFSIQLRGNDTKWIF